MHLSGQISDWSINDLLQIMQVTKKTGSLDIDGEHRGRIHFRDGMVTGAELAGVGPISSDTGRSGVADILYVLSTITTGSFSVGPADGPDTSGWSVEDVLTDVEALESLEEEITAAGLLDATGVRLVREIEEPITIAPPDWAVLVSLIPPFGLDHLEERMGRGGAVRILHAMHRLGVSAPITGDEGESGWLDRLADDITPESDEPTWIEQEPIEEEPEPAPVVEMPTTEPVPADVRGVSAPASTTLTDGVYDEIRRLRSKVAER